MSTVRTRVAITNQLLSPDVPDWSNPTVSDVPLDSDDITFENLLPGVVYYVRVWNEDEFGNRSPYVNRIVYTAPPVKTVPYSFSANGYLDSGSPMRAFVKVPDDVQSVSSAQVTLAFRQFMAPATTATTSSGTLTSDSGGGSTTPSGGGSTSGSSADSVTLSGGGTNGTTGPASAGTAHTHLAGSISTDDNAVISLGGHTHTTPSHTHSTPDHDHTVPGHTHSIVYGTFEETYPVSHSVDVRLYKRAIAGTWTLIHTESALTDDLEDIDLTAYFDGPGDWRIEVQSQAAQPNGGRLGLDLFGALEVVI